MEYLVGGGVNSPHQQSLQYLLSKGYAVHIINDEGQMQSVTDLDAFLMGRGIDSDNVVLVRA